MMIDRQGTGLAILRICLGLFFLSQGLAKYRWFLDSSILAAQLTTWTDGGAANSITRWYLDEVAVPGVAVYARLVPLAEIAAGVALLIGFWTPVAALFAFFMALNFAVASGAIFGFSYLTSGVGLPVIGGTLALAFGGVRLPWSVR